MVHNFETQEQRVIREMQYELDRLKHEVKLLRISVDSHERRMDTQIKTNDTFLAWLTRISK